MNCAARVDRGLIRESNQDVARVIPRFKLVLVADGAGGHEHGDILVGAAWAGGGLDNIGIAVVRLLRL